MGFFDFLKLLISEKNNYEINSVDIYFYHNSKIIPIFQYLYFPVRNFSHGIFPIFQNGNIFDISDTG